MSASPGAGRRIGVFGGAFDPPHVGHVTLAQTALEQLQLDELRVIPTGQAWHKTRVLTPATHRLAMARLAFATLQRVVVDPRETQRSGASYTVDTLLELQAEFAAAQWFLVLGQDQAQSFTTWHRWKDIQQLAIICIAVRANFTRAGGQFDASSASVAQARYLEMPSVPVSSTDIRHAVANHQNVDALVFEPVARYIEHHHLYRTA